MSANAGILDAVSGFFADNKVEASEKARVENSQTISLPQAVLNPNSSIGGGDINIVDNTALLPDNSQPGQDSSQGQGSDQISIYVVRQGDTLSQIAEMFGVSKNTIIWGNDLKGSTLSVGQTLAILPVSGVKHVVKSGETIKSIVNLYNADLNDVLQYNGLKSDDKLAVGDEIIIPGGEISQPAASTAGTKSSAGGERIIKTWTKDYSGYYLRPIVGGVKTQGIHGYNAVDLASSIGTPIMASADGEVIISKNSGWNGGYGQYIVIKHDNGTQTLYGHLSKNNVSQGDVVVQGEVIGLMGSTGHSTGPHVHFEVRGAKNPF